LHDHAVVLNKCTTHQRCSFRVVSPQQIANHPKLALYDCKDAAVEQVTTVLKILILEVNCPLKYFKNKQVILCSLWAATCPTRLKNIRFLKNWKQY